MEVNPVIQGGLISTTLGGPESNVAVNKQIDVVNASVQMENQGFSESGSSCSDEMLKEAVTVANARLKFGNNDCEFVYERDLNRVAIKVINRETKQIIREIPSEATLEMLKKLQEITGMLIDERG